MKTIYLAILILLTLTTNLWAQVPAYVPTSGLVGWWPFNGNANDLSGNGINGTINGATLTSDRNGYPNAAYEFFGSNWIECGFNPNLNVGTGSFTISCWATKNGGNTFQHLVTRNEITSWPNATTSYGFRYWGGGIGIYASGNATTGNGSIATNPLTNLSSWNHFVCVYNSSTGTISIYVNGILSTSGPIASNIQNYNNNGGLFFGVEHPTVSLPSGPNFLTGKLDDIGIWNRALSAAEITGLYTNTPAPTVTATNSTICAGQSTTLTAASASSGTPCATTGLPSSLTTGLVGYWPFCGNANDASGNGNNGTVNGATLTTDRFGTAGSAYNFGVNQTINVGALPNLGNNPSSYTQSAWFSIPQIPTAPNNTYPFMSKRHDNTGTDWMAMLIHTDGQIKCYVDDAGYTGAIWATSSNFSLNNWHHVVCLKDLNNYKIYLDGVLTNTIVDAHQMSGSPLDMIFGAQLAWNKYFEGQLDDIGIWNRALTAAEIQELYTQGQATYSWSPGGATTPSITVSPTTTTTYTCTVTNGGATSTVSQSVTVNALPNVNAGLDQTVFAGSSVTLAGSGATTYSWDNGVTNNTPFTANTTTTYTVTGTSNGCTANDQVLVTVLPAPTLTASSSTICAGQSTTLTAATTSIPSACPSLSGTLSSGLVGFWPFCGNANDASGNGNNGTVNGATLTTDRFGNANSAYSFDGVNDLIRVSHQSSLNLIGNYSISIWFIGDYQNIFNNNWTLISKRDDNGSCCSPNIPYDVFIPFNSTNYAVVSMAYAANGNYIFATPPNSNPITSNVWQNAVITNNSGNLSVYLNGSNIYSTFLSNTLRNSNISDLLFGSVNREFGAEWMNGKLDDIGIWDRALTTSEIQQLYNQGQATYSWSPGSATTPSITVSPTTTTNYTCTVTDPSGTSCTATQTITVNPTPTVNAGVDQIVCNGSTATLTATGATTYSWTNSVQNGVAFSPIATTTYTVTGTDANGCTGTDAVTVTLVPTPTITATNTTICAGQNTTLTAAGSGQSGGILYSITKNVNSQWSVSWPVTVGANYQLKVVGTYGIANGVQGLDAAFETATQLPYNQACTGYQDHWLLSDGCPARPTPDVYNANNTYYYNILNSDGSIDFSFADCCYGDNTGLLYFELTPLPAIYSWSPGGATTPSITVSPTTTTTYTCTVTDANGNSCSQDQLITVNPTPTVNAGVDQNICSGSTATLTATGAASYSWSNSVQNGLAFTPIATANYTVTGTDANGCTGTDAVTVTLVPTPTTTATNTTICAGQSTTMTAATTSTPSACPTLSGTLSSGLVGFWPFCGNANDASGNGNNGTVNGATLTTDRFGNANSAYSFDGVDDYIETQNINFGGQSNYSISGWFKLNVSYSAGFPQHYLLWNGSTSSPVYINVDNDQLQIPCTQFLSSTSINNWHNIAIIKTNSTVNLYLDGIYLTSSICSSVFSNSYPLRFGATAINTEYTNGTIDDIAIWNRALTASEIQQLYTQGQATYSWSPGGATTPSITVSPTTTTTYTCTVNDPSGTSCTATQTITVNPTPTVNAGVDQNICSGSTATLTATGATTYSWTNSVQNGVAFTPIATTTYTVTGTDANGCTGTDAVTLTIVPAPTISATNTSVCAGQSTTLTASTTSGTVACPSLSGSLTTGLVGYWPFCGNANDASGNGNNGTVNGATLTTDRFGNTNSAYSFNGSNSIDIGTNGFATGNSQVTLSGWVYITTNPAGVSYIVGYGNPNLEGSVFATGVYGSGGLFGTFYGAIYDAISNINCPLNSWNLITTVKETNGTVKIYLNANLIYTQTAATPQISNVSGRIGRAVWNSSEYWNGKIDDVAVWNRALTAAEIQQLYTTGQATYSWSPGGATTPSITVSPTTTTTYTCTVTDVNGNSCSASQAITVIPFTGVNAGADQSICSGGSVTLNATGATTFSWNNNVQNGVAFSPLSSGTYIVTGTQNGCTDADTVAVTVVADPLISNPLSASYCQNGGTAAALSASANGGLASTYTYQWYSNTSIANFGGTAIAGASSANYVPSLSGAGTFYFYCTVTQGSATSGCLATSGGSSVSIGAQPAIISQPTASQSACVGASLNDLTITTTGGIGSAAYQWYANTTASTTAGMAIVGANSASYAPSSTTAGNFYYYAMVNYPSAATSCAQATSQVANVNIINDPIFTQVPPANQTVCIGGTTPALTISTSGGSGTASYQWYLVNGNTYTTILGATSPSYTPPAFNLAGNYAYSVGMTQTLAGCGTGFSAVANVSVVADPTVSTPTGASYCQGGAASAPLTVIATGGINAGYTYQWYSNGSNNNTTGIPISGANAASYTPPTSTIGNLYYYCLVNQGSGCQASSAPAAIQVGPGPAFTTQPIASQTVCAGASLNTLTVAYSGGVGTPAYQWYSSTTNNNFGGTPIAGASNASFTPNPNVVGLNYYYCVVSYDALTTCSSITSNVAQVNVISNPVFSSSPLASQTICQGSGAQTLSFATSGGSGTASYQWYNVNGSNYTPILGATGLTYTPPTNLPVGTYNYAVAMNQVASGCSTGFSSNSELVVLAQPVVSTPVGGVYCQGGSGQALSVSVSGGLGSSTYQWYQHTINSNSGGTVIPQATASTYTPTLSSLGTLYYYCVVTQNAGCASSSAVATVVSNPSPVISTQPIDNQTICTGGTPSALTVSYTGGVGAASYQWYSNAQNSNVGGTPITGATFSTYIPSNFTTVGSSFYYCVVSLSNSSCPIVTSNVAVINAVANPSVNGPLSATYCQSTSVAQPLSVVANGGTSNNYNYQWYINASNANFGGNPILGANNANYTPNINGSSTYYYCVVSQAGGCQTASTPAAVTIVSAPTVSSQALSQQSVCIGGTPQALTIATTGGVSAPSYQWYSNNTNTIVNATAIANANTQSFTPNSASTSGTVYYFCQVTYPANSACPTLVSNAAIVNAVADPVISSPNSASYCQNTTSVAPLSVTASGGISTSYTYQWYSNTANSTIGGTPIAGANTNTYVPLVNQIGTIYYYCEVTQGSGCAALSDLSSISVGVAATMNQQPITAQSLCLGQTPSPLTVAVSAGNYALTYQWYSNINNSTSGGTLIVGATSASYLPPSNVLGTKYFYCIVTIAGGGCGNLTSNTASISVVTTPSMFQPNSQLICCQASSAPVNFVGMATSYSWTANSSSPLLTGFSSAGNGDIPANVLTNNSTTPQNIVYLVTPSNQGCNGTPVQFNISVMPCLSVSVPSDQYYCAGESVPAYVFAGVGQTYSWVNTNTSIGLQNAGINFVPNLVAQNTSGTTQVATISVTPNFMGCAGATQSYTIAIYPLPVMDAGLDQEICIGGSVTLNASGAPIVVWDNGIQDGLPFVPNSTATYTVTGTDNNGCQSSDEVVVTVNNPTSATLNVTACDAYTLNGQTYTASGTYSQMLSNSAGCDSTLTLNLTLNYSPNQPNIYVQNQVNLSTDLVPGLTYQWIQCSDLTPISGQTAITYNPTSNGVYAVVVTNGCGSDTSLCTSITTIGLDEHLSSQILLYPNPNNGVFTLEMPQALIGQTIQIFDMAGRLIQENTAQEMKQLIKLNDFATGSYWLRIGSETPMKIIEN